MHPTLQALCPHFAVPGHGTRIRPIGGNGGRNGRGPILEGMLAFSRSIWIKSKIVVIGCKGFGRIYPLIRRRVRRQRRRGRDLPWLNLLLQPVHDPEFRRACRGVAIVSAGADPQHFQGNTTELGNASERFYNLGGLQCLRLASRHMGNLGVAPPPLQGQKVCLKLADKFGRLR